MKKISLLAIASMFSVLAFSQSVATPASTGKDVKKTPTTDQAQAQASTPTFTNVNGTQPSATIAPAQTVVATKTKAITHTAKTKKTAKS